MGEEFDFSEYVARMDSMIHTMLEILDRVKGSSSASTRMATTTPAAVDRTTADAAPSEELIPDKFFDISGESASSPAARDASQEVDDTALPATTSCGAVATPTGFSDASSDELWVPSASRAPSTTSTTTQDIIPVNAISNPSTQSTENATMIPTPTRCSTMGFTQNGGALLKSLARVDDHDASVIEPSALTYTNVCNTTASSSPALPQASSTPSTPSPTLAATQEVVLAVLVVRRGHLTVAPTRCSTPSPSGDIGVLLTSTSPTANAITEQFKGVHSRCLMQGHGGDICIVLPTNKLAAVVSSLMASSTLHGACSKPVLSVHMELDTMSLPAYQLFEEMPVKGYIERLMCIWLSRTYSCYSGLRVPFRHPWPPPMCMGFSVNGFEELRLPWPPPTQAKTISMRAELRPAPWPSFQCWQGVLLMLPLSWPQPKIIRASVDILGSLHDVHDSSMELFPSANSACPQVVLPVFDFHHHPRGGYVLVYDTTGQATWFFTMLLTYSSHQQVERVSQCWSRWITVALLEFVNRPSPVTLWGSLPECVQDRMFYDIGHLILLHLYTKNLQLPWDFSGVIHIGSVVVQVKSKSRSDTELHDAYLVTHGKETTEEVRFWHNGSSVDTKCYNFTLGIMIGQRFIFHCRLNGVLHSEEKFCKFKSVGYHDCTFMFNPGGHYVLCCHAKALVMILWAPMQEKQWTTELQCSRTSVVARCVTRLLEMELLCCCLGKEPAEMMCNIFSLGIRLQQQTSGEDFSGVLLFYCQHHQVLMLYVQQQLPLASVWWFVHGLLSGGFSGFRFVNGVACIPEILWYGLQLTTVLLLQIKCTILDSMEPMHVSWPRCLKLGFLMIVSQLVYAEECSILDQITKRNVHRRLHLVEGRLMAKQRCCTWHSEDVRQAIFDLSLRLFAEHKLWGSSDMVHDQEADCFISSIQEVDFLPAMAGSWSCNTDQSSAS